MAATPQLLINVTAMAEAVHSDEKADSLPASEVKNRPGRSAFSRALSVQVGENATLLTLLPRPESSLGQGAVDIDDPVILQGARQVL